METATKTNEIRLVTKPKIVHRLQELGADVTKRLQDLNIESLVATEDTVKSLKELRADLNKELDGFEEQRKFVKEGVLDPYNEFESIYRTEISEKYKNAITLLKDKIALVETKIKDEKKTKVKLYYNELCAAEKIDFISFDRLNLDINLSTSEKAYREKCDEMVKKTIDDLNLIHTTEFEAEILTEYKASLNVSQAITTVKTRKDKEKEEKAKLHQAELSNRMAKIKALGMIYDEFTKTFVYDDDNFITYTFVNNSTGEEFTQKYIECEQKIKEIERAKAAQSNVPQPEIKFDAKPAAPISTPVVKEPEETVIASFEVSGTMAQLKALGQYMRTNNITYKNI